MNRHELETVAALQRALPDCSGYTVAETYRKLHRCGSTLKRLAGAACNGDWPCDNGERKVKPCSRCEALVAPSTLVRDFTVPKVDGRWIPMICQDCRTTERAKRIAAEVGLTVTTQGDPRGYVLRVVLPNGTEIGIA